MARFNIDIRSTKFLGAGEVRPVNEYADGKPTGNQDKAENGQPLWRVKLMKVENEQAGEVSVRVPSATEPELPLMQEVRLEGVSVYVQEFGQNAGRISYSAEKITAAGESKGGAA